MDTFKMLYTVLGGLGVFFYGMKSMSDALQAVAGDMIRNAINSLTSNRFLAVAVGIVVTMAVQSSSITTVMVVGFVNAGLMQLTQAIGVILGANIGTTITGWIISIKIGKYGLLLIGVGIFPLMFGKNDRWRNIGRILFGIGMIFFGLQIMSGAFKPLRSDPSFHSFLVYFSGQDYGSYIASIGMGCILTMIIQSSSAMLGITMAMATTGVIEFHTAAALVLGENIGTTITALLASVGGNVAAKRAARAHAIFNCLGVLVLFSFFPHYVKFIEWLIPGDSNLLNAAGDKPNIAVHIASGHTIFNVVATLIFIPLLNILAKVVIRITPDAAIKEKNKLVLLGNPQDIVPATALAQAHVEVQKMKELVDKMFLRTRSYLESKSSDARELAKIKDYERITDNIQKEVTVFVGAVMEKALSHHQSHQAQSLVRVADELESVADYLDKLATYKTRFDEANKLEGEARKELFDLMDGVEEFYHHTTRALINPETLDPTGDTKRSEFLRIKAEKIRKNHLNRVGSGEYTALTSLTFSDMVVALRKIRSHCHNITQALERVEES